MPRLSSKLRREYRPRQALYTPVYFSYLWNVIRSKKALYPYDANPGMPPVGLLQFSKWQILGQIDEKYCPKTFLISADEYVSFDHIQGYVQELGGYPVIAKPDVGERGAEVMVVRSEKDLRAYMAAHRTEDILIQQFITSPIELGVFYYRFPNEQVGHISGVTMKEFFTVTGDGIHTLRELVEQDERGVRYTQLFSEIQGDRYEAIIQSGEHVQLTHVGNHCKGTKFVNGNHLINDNLVNIFDTIAKQIDGFYYGRFDLKVTSLEDLYAGKGISVLEVNGIQSEPSHIYDPEYSLFDGLKELMHHRQVMYEISKINREEGQEEVGISLIDHLHDVHSLKQSQKYHPVIEGPITSLDMLIHSIDQHITWQQETYGNINLQRCQYILDLYEGDDRQDKVTFNTEHYTRYAVHMPDDMKNFDIYIMGWDDDQMSDIHDHASNGCIMKFVQGTVTETRYNKIEAGFEIQKQTTYTAGGPSAYIADDIGYHAIGTLPGDRAVSIHIYSPAQWKTTYFGKE